MRTPAASSLKITRRDLLRALCAALATAFTPLAADLRRLTCWRSGTANLRFAAG